MAYGYFRCSACSRHWTSAHATKEIGQLCKDCRKYIRPHRVIERKPGKAPILSRGKPHRSDLCVACFRGKCRHSTSYFSDHLLRGVVELVN